MICDILFVYKMFGFFRGIVDKWYFVLGVYWVFIKEYILCVYVIVRF